MKLYNESDLRILIEKTKHSFTFFIVFLSLSIISILSFILCSFYEIRLLFQIVGSIVTVLFVGLTIYFLDRNLFFKRIATEYLNILNEEGDELNIQVIDIKKRTITLSDKSTVYEITGLSNKKSKTYYLSSLFEPILEINKNYRIITAFNYVKEYYEED